MLNTLCINLCFYFFTFYFPLRGYEYFQLIILFLLLSNLWTLINWEKLIVWLRIFRFIEDCDKSNIFRKKKRIGFFHFDWGFVNGTFDFETFFFLFRDEGFYTMVTKSMSTHGEQPGRISFRVLLETGWTV